MDQAISRFFAFSLRPAWLDTVMIFVTHLSDAALIWLVLCAGCLPRRPTRKLGVTALLAIALCYVLIDLVLKPLVARPRPYAVMPDITLLIPPLRSFSFPSGHAAHSMAAACVLWRGSGRARGWLFVPFAVLIGFSRIYLTAHYLTDVLFGFALGVLMALLAIHLIRRWYPVRWEPK